MSKVRVYEVAKQLNMDQKTLVTLFQSMGVGDVRNHMSAVEPEIVERLKRHLERQKSPEVVEERIRPTVVKRRARGTEGDLSGVPAARPSSSGLESAPSHSAPIPRPSPSASHQSHHRPAPEPEPVRRRAPSPPPSSASGHQVAPSSPSSAGRHVEPSPPPAPVAAPVHHE